MPKQMEGDNLERRRRAREARDSGELPSAELVTAGASKQRRHLGGQADHDERIAAKAAGKQDADHKLPDTRPGREAAAPDGGGVSVVVCSAILDGRRVSYRDGGLGDDAVVLIHGFPLAGAAWEYQFDALGEDYRVIAPDLMGLGGSEAPEDPGAYSVEGWADDVAGLIGALGLDRAVLVGEGLGGNVAFEVFRRHAELVAALVLADVATAPDSEEDRRRRADQQGWLRSGGDVESLADRWLQFVSGVAWSRRAEVVKKAKQWIADTPRAGLVGALDALDRLPDIRHDVAKVDVPMLVMMGAEHPLMPHGPVPVEPDVVVPGGGQFSNIESPGAFNRAVGEFLDAL